MGMATKLNKALKMLYRRKSDIPHWRGEENVLPLTEFGNELPCYVAQGVEGQDGPDGCRRSGVIKEIVLLHSLVEKINGVEGERVGG
ncbi:hypothetical protein KM043_017867 [Ampulex compressa]|nr:hypothetical protein KM043_017867 [Ampulex compressa]